jgi:hypothetical protein
MSWEGRIERQIQATGLVAAYYRVSDEDEVSGLKHGGSGGQVECLYGPALFLRFRSQIVDERLVRRGQDPSAIEEGRNKESS